MHKSVLHLSLFLCTSFYNIKDPEILFYLNSLWVEVATSVQYLNEGSERMASMHVPPSHVKPPYAVDHLCCEVVIA